MTSRRDRRSGLRWLSMPTLLVPVVTVIATLVGTSVFAQEFESPSVGFSMTSSRLMVRAVAAASHQQPNSVETGLRKIGFSQGHLIRCQGVHCAVGVRDDVVVLAFRGSTTFDDWVTDLKFAQIGSRKTGLKGRVHRGFWKALESGWSDILVDLRRLMTDDRQLWITGHSLGGGLAQLAALLAVRDGLPVAGVYTYGAPRVGDDRLARELDGVLPNTLYRIVNPGDPVPHLAPTDDAEKAFVQLVVPSDKRSMRWSLRGALKLAEYRHAGRRVELGTYRPAGEPAVEKDDDDSRFWQEKHQTFGNGGWLEMMAGGGMAARSHILATYLGRHQDLTGD